MKMRWASIPKLSNQFWATYGAIFFAFNCFEFALDGHRLVDLAMMFIMAAFGYWYAGGCMSSRQVKALQAFHSAFCAAGDDDDDWGRRFQSAFAAEGYELAGRDSGGILVKEITGRK